MYIKIASYAKINLGLKIFGRCKNNLHRIETITQSVDLCDYITISSSNDLGINLICEDYMKPYYKNTIYIAAKNFLKYTNIENVSLNIKLEKKIPVGSGLGGGSSNAASVIFAMNTIFNTKLNQNELLKIASEVGSDVPMCLIGGTLITKGTGEKVEKISKINDCIFLILKPDFCVDTKKAYDIYDIEFEKSKKNFDFDIENDKRLSILLNSINEGNIEKIFKNTFNDFENVISCDKNGFRLTGSGSAIYKMFSTEVQAKIIFEKMIKEKVKVYWSKPVDYGLKIIME